MSNAQKPADRPTSYPEIGARLQHAHCNETAVVVDIERHSDVRKTRQRMITMRLDSNGEFRCFEMSVRNFWFNWTPA
jgi:hypothetical protein